MKIAVPLVGLMLPLAGPAADPDGPRAPPPPPHSDGRAPSPPTPNLYPDRADCESIPRQVAGEDRRYDAMRLDRLPPGKALLAVHRSVDGCPIATFVHEERARR